MRRLEGVDGYINETVANTAELEERLEALQNRRHECAPIGICALDYSWPFSGHCKMHRSRVR